MEESVNMNDGGNMYQQDALHLSENPGEDFGRSDCLMEEMRNMADGREMYEHEQDALQLGGNPDDGFDHSDRLFMERLDNMSNGQGYQYEEGASAPNDSCRYGPVGDRAMMSDMENAADGGSLYAHSAQDGLQTDETRGQNHCMPSVRILEQDVERSLAQMMEETYLDDDEMDARMAATEKELAEDEERRIKQHEELVQLRQQGADIIAETKKMDDWNKRTDKRLDEIEAEFLQLGIVCDKVATDHSTYVDEKRPMICKYAQYVEKIEQRASEALEAFKEQGRRELADLDALLLEEQAKTDALLKETNDSEDLDGESDEIDKEIRDLEIKLEVKMKRDKEESECSLLLKQQIAEEEEKLKRADEMEVEVKRMRQVNEGKRALLKAEFARKDEMERKANLEKSRLETTTARYNSLKQMSSETEKKLKQSRRKRATVNKDLEQCIKDLVILPRKNAFEIDGMRRRRNELEKLLRREERKLQESQKESEEGMKRNAAMEREISELNQDTLQKRAKLESLKTRFIQQEYQHQSSVEVLETIKEKIEERENENAYAEFCYEDELAKEAVEIEHLRLAHKETDEAIALRELEKNILVEEWEALFNETETIRDAIKSRASTPHFVEPGDIWLEEMKNSLETEVRDLKETCSKARQRRDDLRSEIEELRAAVKAQEAAAESAKKEEESADSTTPSLKATLLLTLEMIDELKRKIEERNESIRALKETEAELEKEIESLRAVDPNPSHRRSDLKQEIEEVEKQIEEKRKNVDALQTENTALEKKIAEEQKRGEEALRAKREEVAAVDKLALEKEEEITQSVIRLEKWREMIKGNRERRANRLKRTEESERNLNVLQKEVSDLEEKIKQLEKEASEKEKKRKANIEALQKELVTIKKTAENKEKAFNKEKNTLMERIKASQSNLKTLISEKATIEEAKVNAMMSPPGQEGWSTSKFSGRSYSDTNTFGVLTQRASTQPQEKERSPSSESVSSIELSNEDMAAVRSGRVNIWSLVTHQSQEKKSRKKISTSQK